jgi:hypothetical protein
MSCRICAEAMRSAFMSLSSHAGLNALFLFLRLDDDYCFPARA